MAEGVAEAATVIAEEIRWRGLAGRIPTSRIQWCQQCRWRNRAIGKIPSGCRWALGSVANRYRQKVEKMSTDTRPDPRRH